MYLHIFLILHQFAILDSTIKSCFSTLEDYLNFPKRSRGLGGAVGKFTGSTT